MKYILGFLLAALSFSSPVHIPVQLAGNFGEPRPNHFHGGIDIKTDRGVNFGVYSVADGYVARVIVEKYGFGYALVIAHPNGHSSIYVHLNRFAPQIEAAVKQWQYKNHQFIGDISFTPGQIAVHKGQFIGLSGSTGASQAPHLHLEYHETKTGVMLDPLIPLSHILTDNTPPTAYSFKSFPLPSEGVFQHTQESRVFGFSKQKFEAWGKVGFAIFAHDNMDSVYNNLGVRYIQLYCDGKLVFSSNVNEIPANNNPMINVWGDFEHYQRSHIWFLKSFIEPSNRLPILWADKDKGIINFNQSRDYHLKYVLKDYYGNKSEKEFIVRGRPEKIVQMVKNNSPYLIQPTRHNILRFKSVKLEVGKYLLSKNYLLHPQILPISDAVSFGYRFQPNSTFLLGEGTIHIKINKNIPDPSKLFIASCGSMNEISANLRFLSSTYKNGWVSGKIRDLGKIYYAAYDDIPPTIQLKNTNPRDIIIKLADNASGIRNYECYIDNQFALFTFGKDSRVIRCNLFDTPILPAKKERELKVIAKDNVGNTKQFKAIIKY